VQSNIINDYIKQAEKAANAVDSSLKLKTYELVLTHLLQGGASQVTGSTPKAHGTTTVTPSTEGSGSPLDKISSWLEVSPQLVSEVLDLDGDSAELKIPTSKIPSKVADAQRFLVLIKLAADKIGFGLKTIPARTLVSLCRNYSCADGNFAANIKDYDDFIGSKGARGKMKTYELRLKGVEKARDELKAITGV